MKSFILNWGKLWSLKNISKVVVNEFRSHICTKQKIWERISDKLLFFLFSLDYVKNNNATELKKKNQNKT